MKKEQRHWWKKVMALRKVILAGKTFRTIIFTDVQDVLKPRPWFGEKGFGIAMLDLNGRKRIIKAATEMKTIE